MLSVRGVYQDNIVRLPRPIAAREGQDVIVVFLDEAVGVAPRVHAHAAEEADWDAFEQLTEAHTVQTGISDLAHQHDHYLYGKPKAE
ncbi:MAG: hypothetical protein FJ011_18875 [Chloroflexi bacterium]|nr:hypothetical protein [Chloroflexota bacterium]